MLLPCEYVRIIMIINDRDDDDDTDGVETARYTLMEYVVQVNDHAQKRVRRIRNER